MPIDLVYFNENVRCYRDGRVERKMLGSNQFGKIGDWILCDLKPNDDGYLRTEIDGRQKLLHRLLGFCFLGLDLKNPKIQIDHINRIRTDNRVENLQIATNQQNGWNRNAKGYTKKKSKYHAQIKINQQCIYLGIFDTPEEAHQAYLDAKAIHHV